MKITSKAPVTIKTTLPIAALAALLSAPAVMAGAGVTEENINRVFHPHLLTAALPPTTISAEAASTRDLAQQNIPYQNTAALFDPRTVTAQLSATAGSESATQHESRNMAQENIHRLFKAVGTH